MNLQDIITAFIIVFTALAAFHLLRQAVEKATNNKPKPKPKFPRLVIMPVTGKVAVEVEKDIYIGRFYEPICKYGEETNLLSAKYFDSEADAMKALSVYLDNRGHEAQYKEIE